MVLPQLVVLLCILPRNACCALCTYSCGQPYLQALRQLLHVSHNIGVYALPDRDGVQPGPVEQVWIINLRNSLPDVAGACYKHVHAHTIRALTSRTNRI